MASAGVQLEDIHHLQESPSDSAFGEAQKWIEQVTGRSFGYKDFRTGLENGVLLCELLNAIKPGLVKKINRLPTPIAGLLLLFNDSVQPKDNIILFLRGCKELGLKDSQLFDPSDLQDTSNRVTVTSTDYNRKLKNVLVTVYWLGKAANNCTSFNRATLNLKEFEGLLTQMRKETEDIESPKRSIRDSGYIDCWDSERSDSLSPPRHGRDDSFDSLDSFGSRSQQTPSPDVVLRGSSDGRGSDSESDFPHRRIPDMKKDDMLTRRTSQGEIKTFVPFNQYLPNKSNQTAYIPAPLRKKKAEREEYRKSWSTATSPLGGERPFSENHPETIMEEQSEALQCEKDGAVQEELSGKPAASKIENNGNLDVQSSPNTIEGIQVDECEAKEGIQADECEAKEAENQKLKIREQAGIKVMSAAKRFESQKQVGHDSETPDIVLRKENAFLTHYAEPSEEEEEGKVPDIEKDDLAMRRVRMDQTKTTPGYNHVSSGSYTKKDGKWEGTQKPSPSEPLKIQPCTSSEDYGPAVGLKSILTKKKCPLPEPEAHESKAEEQEKVPDIQRDDLANRKNQNRHSRPQEAKSFINTSITEKDLKTWERLKLSTEASADETIKTPEQVYEPVPAASVQMTTTVDDDFAVRKARAHRKGSGHRQKFVHFGPVTEIDQQRWAKLSIVKPLAGNGSDEEVNESANDFVHSALLSNAPSCKQSERKADDPVVSEDSSELAWPSTDPGHRITPVSVTQEQTTSKFASQSEDNEQEEEELQLPDTTRDDMMVRRLGTFRKQIDSDYHQFIPVSVFPQPKQKDVFKRDVTSEQKDGSSSSFPLSGTVAHYRRTPSPDLITCMVVREERPQELKCRHQDSSETQNRIKLPEPEDDNIASTSTESIHKQMKVTSSQFLPATCSNQQEGEEEEINQGLSKSENVNRTMPPGSCLPHLQAPLPLRVNTVERDRASGQKEGGECEEEYQPALEEDSGATHQDPTSTQSNQSVDWVLQGPVAELQEVPERKEKPVLRFSPRSAVSDDVESMSMFDMRDEEEAAAIQPHSRAYQEQLQNVNSLLKEEDDKWQDDLARWKNRRRSASQDLIKKEEERRKMERMLSGEYDLTERRKSIKTYKEIVEEKERREKELHEAYMKAKSREEAEMVLQKYIEKFTISEAILERLQMPKILERRHSVESNLSPSKETSPMKYLRQQSLPAPKFTASFQATIAPSNESEAAVSTDIMSPNKTSVTKSVPMLTPKPYSQPKNKQALKTFKVDGKDTMNGEVCNGTEEKEKGCTTFAPSPSNSLVFEGVAKVDESPLELKQDTTHVELILRRPKSNSVSRELTDTIQEETEAANQKEESTSEMSVERLNLGHTSQEGFKQSENTLGHFSTAVSSLEFTPCYPSKEPVAKKKDENRGEEKMDVPVKDQVVTSKACDQEDGRAFEYFKTEAAVSQGQQGSPHPASVPLMVRNSWQRSQFFSQSVDFSSSEEKSVLIPPENASKRSNLWSWDPEEERKRQERWQQEQERLLQERYQKEQEKLKEEWDKAQKEVEEEERKYYEEERKIIEDTVVPFTTTSSSTDLPASSSFSLAVQMNRNSQPLERSLPEQEPEQELKENQMVAELNSGADQGKEKKTEVVREQQDLMWDLDGGSFHRIQEDDMQKEKKSINKMTAEHPESLSQRVTEQGQQRLVARQDSPAKMQLNLLPDISWDHQLLTQESCASSDVSLKTPPLNYGLGHQAYSLGGLKRTASPENIRAGQASPCSPSQLCQSPNRSVSGKKLCSSCGLPLGKGAAMIIDTLNLYFHIQCFKCGVCKGELGDVTTGTDVRIRNGLLNCNDCYIRSRTAGQPTPL
ncbi:LIM and calponin homology domains-containing protein 1 [Microcaecilia unicolor]|uniref:LIM and calponin homology domains-containing protein 1 n=1 Tax=Microcaecilia unicolor TaxID=1415580 RepID=A0A6P7X428_9AMPH|nr:LIM and calponin homology domains-containing protein 1 [Microcaecilia unicolor]